MSQSPDRLDSVLRPFEALKGLEAAILGYTAQIAGGSFREVYDHYIETVKEMSPVQRRDFFLEMYDAYTALYISRMQH